MNNVQAEMKKAVDCGLWPLYRYDPNKTEKPFSLDYKKPSVPSDAAFSDIYAAVRSAMSPDRLLA